ncbi:MAG: hypothetical protein AAGA15_11205 [Pseudomonadota bacterium]
MKRFLLAALAALSLAASAHAATITYELRDTQFVAEDFLRPGETFTPIAGQISGSFDFDTVLDSVTRASFLVSGLAETRFNGLYDTIFETTDVNIRVGQGPAAVGDPVFNLAADGDFADGQPLSLVRISFNETFPSTLGQVFSVNNGATVVEQLNGVTGTAVPVAVAPVPVPLGAGLLLTGLLVLPLLRRRAA